MPSARPVVGLGDKGGGFLCENQFRYNPLEHDRGRFHARGTKGRPATQTARSMHGETPTSAEVKNWLATLGIETLCQWDLLIFLQRHPTSLVGADYLARLLGFTNEPVVAALDVLESLGFLLRSRLSQGARIYQFTVPPDPLRGRALKRLTDLASERTGRLLISRQLRREDQPPQQGLAAAVRSVVEQAPRIIRVA